MATKLCFVLRNELPESDVVTKTVNILGQTVVSGNDKLKGTEAYPIDFGRAVAAVHCANQDDVLALAESLPVGGDVDVLELFARVPGDTWEDAELGLVFSLLSRMRRH